MSRVINMQHINVISMSLCIRGNIYDTLYIQNQTHICVRHMNFDAFDKLRQTQCPLPELQIHYAALTARIEHSDEMRCDLVCIMILNKGKTTKRLNRNYRTRIIIIIWVYIYHLSYICVCLQEEICEIPFMIVIFVEFQIYKLLLLSDYNHNIEKFPGWICHFSARSK